MVSSALFRRMSARLLNRALKWPIMLSNKDLSRLSKQLELKRRKSLLSSSHHRQMQMQPEERLRRKPSERPKRKPESVLKKRQRQRRKLNRRRRRLRPMPRGLGSRSSQQSGKSTKNRDRGSVSRQTFAQRGELQR